MRTINWARVYEQQAGKLIGSAYKYVKDRKQAEDIVQNSFIIAIQKAATFKGKGAFEAWLRRIVINECLMFLRANKRNIETNLTEVEGMEDKRMEEEDVEEFSALKKVAKAEFTTDELMETANLLVEHHRLVFYLYVIDDFSHKEIAQKLNISEGTSKSHLNRARKKLQELLYEKTMEKKKRLLPPILFFVLLGKTNRVDAMYRKAFKGLELSPLSPTPDLQQALQMCTGSVGGVASGAMALTFGSLAICGGVITYLVVNTNTTEQEDVSELSIQEIRMSMTDTTVVAKDFFDSASSVSKKNSISTKKEKRMEEELEESIEEEKPVIIKKVTVIDTIYED